MILKQGHKYEPMPHDGKVIRRIYRGGRCYYIASPYSPEATQALKAAFPQYWTAIRDYGYAHPQLVPFINEDPMLIVSLVEVGKERWLVSSEGAAQISTPILQNDAYIIEIIYMAEAGTGGGCICSTDTKTSDNFARYFPWSSNNKWYQQSNVFSTYSQISARYNEMYKLRFTPNGGMIDLVTNEIIFNKCGTYTDGRCWALQSRFDRDKSHFALFKGTDGINTVEMYPFIRNGENGMLDILSGTFHPNANTEGAFTIEITDKE